MTFRYVRLRLDLRAGEPVRFGRLAANRLRGALGSQLDPAWFAPRAEAGPSGLKDRPRPFVLRARRLDHTTLEAGDVFQFSVHIFDAAAVDAIIAAASGLGWCVLESAVQEAITIEPVPEPSARLRVRFHSATELKDGSELVDEPAFPVLFARAASRIRSLGLFYGGDSLDEPPVPDARLVEWSGKRVSFRRTSTRTGQTHPLGGFTGDAIYEGDLTAALPWLTIAAHTGVGRQTVWGKGEISVERLA